MDRHETNEANIKRILLSSKKLEKWNLVIECDRINLFRVSKDTCKIDLTLDIKNNKMRVELRNSTSKVITEKLKGFLEKSKSKPWTELQFFLEDIDKVIIEESVKSKICYGKTESIVAGDGEIIDVKEEFNTDMLEDEINQKKDSGKSTESDLSYSAPRNHIEDPQQHDETFKCTKCDVVCSRSSSFARHLKSHATDILHCKHCVKLHRFNTQKDLDLHMSKHVIDKNCRFPCNECILPFTQKRSLDRHIETVHQKKKDFVCHICGKKFGQSPHLRDHIQTHSAEKVFLCDKCPSKFAQSNGLKKHVKKWHH